MADAPPGDGSGLLGRVCLLGDMRALEVCAASGAGGLTVTLGAQTAVTAADGTFTMPVPSGTMLTWRVTGAAIVPVRMVFSAVPQIPAVTHALYDQLLLENGVLINAGQGSVVARVVHQGMGVAGATGTIATSNESFYDGNSSTLWNQNSTGPQGVIWIPAAAAGAANLRLDVGGTITTVPVVVDDGGITFTTIDG